MTPRCSSIQRSFSTNLPSSWGRRQFVKQTRPLGEDISVRRRRSKVLSFLLNYHTGPCGRSGARHLRGMYIVFISARPLLAAARWWWWSGRKADCVRDNQTDCTVLACCRPRPLFKPEPLSLSITQLIVLNSNHGESPSSPFVAPSRPS